MKLEKFLDFYSIILFGIIVAMYVVAFVCLIRLWENQDSRKKRFGWALIILIPFLGPIFYGAWYRPPSVQPEEQQVTQPMV